MSKHAERPYVVTATNVMGEGRGSTALTRDAIQLEIAMRLVIEGRPVKSAWEIAEDFVREMDRHLEPLPEPPPSALKPNAGRLMPNSQ